MTLTIDIGNTRIKWALFDHDQMLTAQVAERNSQGQCSLHDELRRLGYCNDQVERAIVCATGRLELEKLGLPCQQVHVLNAESKLPIKVDYATPHTLGADRKAAACGAHKLCPGRGCVIVDAGTCITVDYMDAQGVFRGGAILPGIEMKFRALHTFTAKLPLLTTVDAASQPVTGQTTQESMEAGVLTATRFAVEGFVEHYREREPNTAMLLTGGDANWIWGEGRLRVTDCLWEPYLVMIGLNEILKEND